MDLGLEGKVVIVSGGATGIGAAIVQTLVDEGARPVVLARREADRDDIDWLWTDLADDAQCRAAVEEVLNRHDAIDGLVNCAGRNDGVGLEHGPAAFRASLDQNLIHYYTLMHLCLPALKASRGAVVNVSSKAALTGQGGTSAYVAAKAAQLGLTREWAAELAADGVRVNAVIPGEVMTPMYQEWLNTFEDPVAKRKSVEANVPFRRRMTTAGEIAAAVVFLLSERSGHTTGQFHTVDGGYVHLDRHLTMPDAGEGA